MQRIGLLSDTHGYMDEKILSDLSSCDQIWHAGDIGSPSVARQLAAHKPFRAVYGNIDGQAVRATYPADQHFTCEGLRIWIRHIAGTPGRYTPQVKETLRRMKVDILVGGHTHILRVERDKSGLIYLNPGAIGHQGIHQVRTLLRFTLQESKILDLEVVQLPR